MGIKRAFVTPLTWADTTDKDDVGTIRREGNKVYKYLQYDPSETTIDQAIGTVVGYVDYEAGTVSADVSDCNGVGAGVAMFAVDASDTSAARYGWYQIRGVSGVLAQDVTAGSVGNAMTLVGAADGELDVSALVTDAIVAYLEDATSSAQKLICMFPY